jgi:hypothetical protein
VELEEAVGEVEADGRALGQRELQPARRRRDQVPDADVIAAPQRHDIAEAAARADVDQIERPEEVLGRGAAANGAVEPGPQRRVDLDIMAVVPFEGEGEAVERDVVDFPLAAGAEQGADPALASAHRLERLAGGECAGAAARHRASPRIASLGKSSSS